MMIKRAVVALSLCVATLAADGKNLKWGKEKVRGISIGGWLVTEPYITPSIYEAANKNRTKQDIVDEYTLCEKLGKEAAHKILCKHWETWAQYEDFKKIQELGFNLVRIPIGFWSFKTFDTPFVSGAAVYLDAAIGWARKLKLKVLIDLHGAPGSQNGYDNSGQRTDTPQWQTDVNVNLTLEVLDIISQKYALPEYQDVVVGIELLNEPAGYIASIKNALWGFYKSGFNQVRKVSDTPVILHDGFLPVTVWNKFLTPDKDKNESVVIDHHCYQIFDIGSISWSPQEHMEKVCTDFSSYIGSDKLTIIGEWSSAMTDCAKYLNGYGRGARYDGTYQNNKPFGNCTWQSDISQWPQSYKDDARKFIEAQIATYEYRTAGWIFWNFKTEHADEWDVFNLIEAGIFPAIKDGKIDFKFGKLCKNIPSH